MLIENSEIRLRKFEEADADALYRFRNDPDVTTCLEGFSSGYSRADLRAWIEAHRTAPNEVLYAIARRDTDLCIGHVGLYQIDHRMGKAEFGIILGDKESQGRGWGKAASKAMIAFGFNELNLHKVHLEVLATNSRARKMYEGLGFSCDGVLRHEQFRDGEYLDVLIMSLLEEEWRSHQAA